MFRGWLAMSAALISGMTSGTSGSRRKACELSTQTAPRFAASGRSALAVASPAAPKTMSAPPKASGVASTTGTSSPLKETVLPTERALASGTSLPTGKFLSSRHWIICAPTTPVAPRMATVLSAMVMVPLSMPVRGVCGKLFLLGRDHLVANEALVDDLDCAIKVGVINAHNDGDLLGALGNHADVDACVAQRAEDLARGA